MLILLKEGRSRSGLGIQIETKFRATELYVEHHQPRGHVIHTVSLFLPHHHHRSWRVFHDALAALYSLSPHYLCRRFRSVSVVVVSIWKGSFGCGSEGGSSEDLLYTKSTSLLSTPPPPRRRRHFRHYLRPLSWSMATNPFLDLEATEDRDSTHESDDEDESLNGDPKRLPPLVFDFTDPVRFPVADD
ncbi:hypothetical protein BJ165DRAFT_1533986 [Panaeolus papilionaceus]|nr:hypothetical protein BJ165DRAFT_1533966 [Panaeolus papilionaceus]KAF9034554.1 hypothetical protein BJ165DRAFT_1533986 [Panaeolus papilionaceus]